MHLYEWVCVFVLYVCKVELQGARAGGLGSHLWKAHDLIWLHLISPSAQISITLFSLCLPSIYPLLFSPLIFKSATLRGPSCSLIITCHLRQLCFSSISSGKGAITTAGSLAGQQLTLAVSQWPESFVFCFEMLWFGRAWVVVYLEGDRFPRWRCLATVQHRSFSTEEELVTVIVGWTEIKSATAYKMMFDCNKVNLSPVILYMMFVQMCLSFIIIIKSIF